MSYTAITYTSLHKFINQALIDGINPSELLAYRSFMDFVEKEDKLDPDNIVLTKTTTSYEEIRYYVEFLDSGKKIYLNKLKDVEDFHDTYLIFYDELKIVYLNLIRK